MPRVLINCESNLLFNRFRKTGMLFGRNSNTQKMVAGTCDGEMFYTLFIVHFAVIRSVLCLSICSKVFNCPTCF